MEDVHADTLSSQLFVEQTRLEADALRNAADAAGAGADAAPLQAEPPPAAKAALRRVAAAALCMALRDLWAAEARRAATHSRGDWVPQVLEVATFPADIRLQLMAMAKTAFAAGDVEPAAIAWRLSATAQLLACEPTGCRAEAATPLLADLLSARMRGRRLLEVRVRKTTRFKCAFGCGKVCVLPHRRRISAGTAQVGEVCLQLQKCVTAETRRPDRGGVGLLFRGRIAPW